MGSPSELSLDYKPNTAYRPVVIPKPPANSEQPAEQVQKIEDFLARLEDERHKIEAFKRELPLCMQLLNNALETYRQQLGGAYQKTGNQGARPVLEEFIPLANMSINGSEKAPASAPSEKASWMVSAQLWSPAAASEPPAKQQQQLSVATMKEDIDCSLDAVSPKLALDSKQRSGGGGGGAFLPFPKEKTNKAGALPELALAPTEKMEVEENRSTLGENGKIEAKGGSNHQTHESQVGAQSSSTQRKARRCWSPDLHRRFVNALQMLGGSQVATPKQIRELMKVDGLTNDEVKSHLQKYRLHTRRPIPQPQPTAAAAPQLVVLGGIWVPPEYAAAAAGPAIYGAHPQAHYAIPHDFYSPALPVPQSHHPHHPHLHRSVPTYKAAAAVDSPESELRSGGGGGGGDRSESNIQGEEEDDDEGHGREEDEEEEEEDQDGIDDAKDMGEEKPALVPSDNINGGSSSTDVALKF